MWSIAGQWVTRESQLGGFVSSSSLIKASLNFPSCPLSHFLWGWYRTMPYAAVTMVAVEHDTNSLMPFPFFNAPPIERWYSIYCPFESASTTEHSTGDFHSWNTCLRPLSLWVPTSHPDLVVLRSPSHRKRPSVGTPIDRLCWAFLSPSSSGTSVRIQKSLSMLE